jgi:ABC-type nitrate/sulfonate/bicarbonate transport system substrate-binding protein
MKRFIVILAIIIPMLNSELSSAQTRRIHVAYSSIAVVQSGLWAAKESNMFRKYGVDAELVYLRSGTTVARAVIAGEFPVALAGGTIVNANLGGGDIAVIGGVVNVPNFYLIAHPSIKTPENLRGKTIGITSYGSSTDFTLRYLLDKLGLDPEKDVKILPMGGQPEILAGFKAGILQAGVSGFPTDYNARKLGFVNLIDMGKIGLDYPVVSLISTRSYIRKDRGTVLNVLKAYAEGLNRIVTDKGFAINVIRKYTRNNDPETLQAGYEYAGKFIENPPNPPFKAIETILAHMRETDPRAKGRKAEEFIDATFFQELETGGFFRALKTKG